MKKITILLAFILAAFNIAAQDENIVRYLQIEKGGDDYEILNIEEGSEYSIRTEADENNKLVVRVYDHNDQLLGEYPENSIIYPLYDEEAVLSPNTIIVTSKQNEDVLINLEDDMIVFKQTANTQSFEVGNILFGGPSFEAPYGYLRKLISKEVKNGQIIFETEQASLLDAFDEISIHRVFDYETLIDEETGELRFGLVGINGESLRAMYTIKEWSFAKKELIKDSSVELTFKGKIQLEFVFTAKKVFGVPYNVKEFKLVGHFSLDANLASNIQAKINIANKELGKVLAFEGARKQVNVLVYLVNTGNQAFLHALEEHWVFGKKNDAVVIIGTTSFPKVDWVSIMAWTDIEEFKVVLRNNLLALQEVSDPVVVANTISSQILLPPEKGGFLRKSMSDYEYLVSGISLPWWANILITLFLCFFSWGVSWVLVHNDWR